MDKDNNPEDAPEEETDFLDIVLRATGWVYLATGLGMLGFFFYWLRQQ